MSHFRARERRVDRRFIEAEAPPACGPARLAMLGVFFCCRLGFAGDDLAPSPSPIAGVTIVSGEEMPVLLGQKTAQIGAFACHGGEISPVPFQVDERDRKDRWVLDHGRAARNDDRPGELDANDALVVRHRSLGDRCPAGVPASVLRRPVEIRVGRADGPLGYVYSGLSDAPRAETPESGRVRYDPKRDRIDAPGYRLDFGKVLPEILELPGSEGAPFEDVLDTLRAQGEARLFGGAVVLNRTEKDFEARLEGYREGPLRVIRSGRYWIRLPLGFRATARLHFAFYDDLVVASATANVRIPPWLIPGDGELSAFFDLRRFAGAKVLLDGALATGTVDGQMNDAEKALDGAEGRWAALLLPDGRVLLLAIRRGGALAKLDQRFFFKDRLSPMPFSFGFSLSGVRRLETGEHPLDVIGVIANASDPDAIARAAEILVSPPPVQATALGVP